MLNSLELPHADKATSLQLTTLHKCDNSLYSYQVSISYLTFQSLQTVQSKKVFLSKWVIWGPRRSAHLSVRLLIANTVQLTHI